MAAIALIFAIVVLLISLGVIKVSDQMTRDRERRTYKVLFPGDLTPEAVEGWLYAISATLRPENELAARFKGVPSIVFEVMATEEGITHRLKIPWQYEQFIIPPMRHILPGIRLVEDTEPESRFWVASAELALKAGHRVLNIPNVLYFSSGLLSNFSTIRPGEALIMQWVVTSRPNEHPPIFGVANTKEGGIFAAGIKANRDEVDQTRMKQETANMNAAVRVGAVAATKDLAHMKLSGLVKSFNSAAGAANYFQAQPVFDRQSLQARVARAASPLMLFPVQLKLSELAAVIGWEFQGMNTPNMPVPISRYLPAHQSVNSLDRILGFNPDPDHQRKIGVSFMESRKHLWTIGGTGSGKTSFLENIALQDMRAMHGVVIVDAKGDLYDRLLDKIPENRRDDVHLIDLRDMDRPIGYNPFEQGDVGMVIDELKAILSHKYPAGGWFNLSMQAGLRTVAQQGYTIMDLPALFMPITNDDVNWREHVIRNVKDPEIAGAWQRINKEGKNGGEKVTQSAWDRLQLLAGRPEISNILGQKKSSFLWKDVVRDKEIVMIRMAGVSPESSSLLGTILFKQLKEAIWANPSTDERSMYVYLDEFQKYLDMPIDIEEMLFEARSKGLGLVLAHQQLDQLKDRGLEPTIMNNVATKIAFNLKGYDDANTVARNFGKTVSAEDLQHLRAYETIAQISTDTGVSRPLSLNTYKPEPGDGTAEQLRYLVRGRDGRPIKEVIDDMERRHIVKDVTMRSGGFRTAEDLGGV